MKLGFVNSPFHFRFRENIEEQDQSVDSPQQKSRFVGQILSGSITKMRLNQSPCTPPHTDALAKGLLASQLSSDAEGISFDGSKESPCLSPKSGPLVC